MNKEDYSLTRTAAPEIPRDEIVNHTPFRVMRGGKDSPTAGLQPGGHEHRLKTASEGQQENFRIVPVKQAEVGHRGPKTDGRYALHHGDLELVPAGKETRRNLGMKEEVVIPRDARRLPQRDEKARTGEQNGRSSADMMHVALTPAERTQEIRSARKRTVTHLSVAEIEKRDAAIIAQLQQTMREAGILPVDKLDRQIASPAVKKHQQEVSNITEGAKGRSTYKEQPAPVVKKKELTTEEIAEIDKSRAESDARLLKEGAEMVQTVDLQGNSTESLHATESQIESARKEMQNDLDNKALTEETGKVLSAMDKKEVESIRASLNEMGMLGSDHQIAYIKKMLEREQKVSGRTLSHEEAIKIMREGIADPSFPKAADYLENLIEAAKARPEHHAPKPQYTQEQIKSLEASRAESDAKLLKGGAEMVSVVDADGKPKEVLQPTESQIQEAGLEMEKDLSIKEYAENVQKQLSAIGEENLTRIRKTLKTEGMLGTDAQTVFVHRIHDWYKQTSNRDIPLEEAIKIMREGVADPSYPKEEEYQRIIAEAAKGRQEKRGPLPERPNYSSIGLSRRVNFDQIAAVDTKQMEMLRRQRSPTLKENPAAKLSISKEAELYFKRQPEGYSKEIESLASQIQAPMSEQTKAIVCIPVAGHQESANIYQTLENYIHQDAPKDQYEILLFVNWPEKDQTGAPLNADATLAEIKRFQEQYPDLPVRLISKQFSQPGTIGQFRKYLTDVALWRSQQRPNKDDELIFISNDADQKGVAPKYISNFISEFSENNVDGMLGQLDWSPADYVNHPLVHAGTRLFQYLNTIGRHRSGGLPSSGANFAFRGSMYAAIGGYLPDVKEGEDIAIGRAIVDGRHTQDSVMFAGARSSRLYTSARRAINALKKGLAPVEQWDQGFGVFDDEVRLIETRTETKVNYDDPAYISRLKSDLETVINRTLDIYEQGEHLGKGANFYRKALGWMGVSYDVVNGNVVITDMKPLIRNLKEFEILGPLQQRIKSGKASAEEEEIYHKLYERFAIAPRDERLEEEQRAKDEMLPKFPLFKQDKLTDTSVPSETLVKDAAAHIEPEREIKDYFARQDEHYMSELVALNSQIEAPMSADTEMAVLIPVAGAQEAGNIYRTLESYSKQSLDTSKFEVVLLVNVPEGKLGSAKDQIELTMAELDRARHDFPQLQVRVARATLPDRQVKIGNIRKMLTDIALLRQKEAGISRDLLLLSNDADNKGISEDYLASYQKYFQDHPDKEGAVGNLHFDPSGFVRFPGLHLKTEFVTRLDQTGFRNGNVTLFGSNSVMKSSIYAAIGGYPTNLKSGEQEWTGSTIRQLRHSPQTLGYVNDAVLTTSIRRGVASYLSSAEGQIAFGDESAEANMRALDIEAMPMYEFTPEHTVQLSQEIGTSVDQIIRAYEQGEHLGKDSYFYREALRSMGIEYEVEGDPQDINSTIKITNISGFIERNKAMRELIEQGETNMAVVVEKVEQQFGGESKEPESEAGDGLSEETPQRKKQNKVIGWVKNIAGNAMSRVRKQKEPAVDQQAAESEVEAAPQPESEPAVDQKKPAETTVNYDQAVAQFAAQNRIDLRGPELKKFILYVKSNNRTDIEQAYDDYLRETAPKEKQPAQEAPERTGNPLTEAALGMAALTESTTARAKPVERSGEVTADMTAILEAGRQNNAEPWYGDFVQNTKTLSQMRAPGFLRSLSREQIAQFDRIMLASLDQMSDIPAYQSNSEELLKTASRNKALADAICERKSPARKLLAQKFEDFIRDDIHAMHYMHQYEHTISQNPLSLFSVTNRDGSFYKGLLAATLRNKELHQTDLANILGIPEVRDLLKQAVYGFEVRSAEDVKSPRK